jgi:hypothetical protein
MVSAISASASSTNAPTLHPSDESAKRSDASNRLHLSGVDLQSVIVDISKEGIQLSQSEAAVKAQEALAKMDVNLDGKLSIDQFSVVTGTG